MCVCVCEWKGIAWYSARQTTRRKKKSNKIIVTQTLNVRSYVCLFPTTYPPISVRIFHTRNKGNSHIFRVIFVVGRVWSHANIAGCVVVVLFLFYGTCVFMYLPHLRRSTTRDYKKKEEKTIAVVTAATEKEQQQQNKKKKVEERWTTRNAHIIQTYFT